MYRENKNPVIIINIRRMLLECDQNIMKRYSDFTHKGVLIGVSFESRNFENLDVKTFSIPFFFIIVVKLLLDFKNPCSSIALECIRFLCFYRKSSSEIKRK